MPRATVIDRPNNEFVAWLGLGGVFAASGALAGRLFQIISPVGGAVFGGAVFGTGRILFFVEKRLHNFFGNSKDVELAQFIENIFLGTVAGTALVNYGLGISLSMVNVVYLTATTVLTAFITVLVQNIIQDGFK